MTGAIELLGNILDFSRFDFGQVDQERVSEMNDKESQLFNSYRYLRVFGQPAPQYDRVTGR